MTVASLKIGKQKYVHGYNDGPGAFKYILPLIAKTCSCLESITDKPESHKYNKSLKILYLNETN